MDATLELQPAPGAATVDEQDRVLDSAYAGDAGVDDLDPPPLTLGVLRVHADQLRREERGLVAPGAGADLEEDILLVIRITREQEALELLLERRLAAGELVDLRLRQLRQLAVAALGQDVARLADPPEYIAVLREALDDLDGVGVLLAEARVFGRLGEDGGIRQNPGDLVGSLFDLTELVKQHRGSAPLCSGTTRPCAPQAIAGLGPRRPRCGYEQTNKNRRES